MDRNFCFAIRHLLHDWLMLLFCDFYQLKVLVFSFRIQLYYLTNQFHVIATVSSYHQANPKNMGGKKKHIQFQYWSEILGFTVCNLKYMMYLICIYEELNN